MKQQEQTIDDECDDNADELETVEKSVIFDIESVEFSDQQQSSTVEFASSAIAIAYQLIHSKNETPV